jgi:hypothetical protein
MSPTLADHQLDFAFPDVHADARLLVTVHRTLRVPDDDTTYGLPPGLGLFHLTGADSVRHDALGWSATDALLPMWQAEAAWFRFSSPSGYPFLVRMSMGGVNAVTGEDFADEVDFETEDYFEVPEQPWLDGFRVDDKTVRQFVAMPLGSGYTAAEQLAGADDGAVRIQVTPLRASKWRKRVATRRAAPQQLTSFDALGIVPAPASASSMGMGAGGSITQSIATPIEPQKNWNTDATSAATLRIVNSADWQALTGTDPHHRPPTITEYQQHGYPWFEWYDDSLARRGESKLSGLKTVREIGEERGEQPLPDNESFDPPKPHVVGP